MATDARAAGRVQPDLDGSGMRIAIVCSRFNDRVTVRLLEGAKRGLARARVPDEAITAVWVPGAFEAPMAAKELALTGRVDGVICVGSVIRGETSHYELVAGECARGIQQAQLDTGVPIAYGVLATEDLDQALARSEDDGGHNVGEECAAAVVEMVGLLRDVRA